jgi:alpha-L-fucosidase
MVTTALVALAALSGSATPVDTLKQWQHDRFGMFIHWGVYSEAGSEWNGKPVNGAGEWLLSNAQIKPEDYEPLAKRFNPTLYDPEKWVKLAKVAGMKYIVITTKHHDGFGLWPSAEGDWNVKRAPANRDLLKPLAEACRREGIKLGFYHSIMDWHHPDYLPRRGWDTRPTTGADMDRYVKYLKAQLKEILTNYGPVFELWFDGQWEGTWTDERGRDLEKYVRSLQPNMLVNNRVSHSGTFGDFKTPEQEIPANGIPGQNWESCMTMNDTWGYSKFDHNWKSAETLITNVILCASKGGNYLLNVGPTGAGEIPLESGKRLLDVGRWMTKNGESIYGTEAGPFPKALPWGRVTRKGNTLYAHLLDKDVSVLSFPGLKTGIKSAKWLDGEALSVSRGEIQLGSPRSAIGVVKVELAGSPVVVSEGLKPGADGRLVLGAGDATTFGGPQFEAGEKNALGFWTRKEGIAEWDFQMLAEGSYQATVTFACEPGNEGAVVAVDAGVSRQSFTVQPTKSWSDFVTVETGPFTLKKGKNKAKVQALSMGKGAVMNLRSVVFTPVR